MTHRVRRLTTPAEIAALADRWPEAAAPPNTFAWAAAAITTRPVTPCWLVWEGDAPTILPLALRRVAGLRVAEWSGIAVTDHNRVLGPTPPAALAELRAALVDLPVDLIRLDDSVGDLAWTGLQPLPPTSTARIATVGSPEDYWLSRSANLRARIGRHRRRLLDQGLEASAVRGEERATCLHALRGWLLARQPDAAGRHAWQQRILPFLDHVVDLPGVTVDALRVQGVPIAVHVGWREGLWQMYWLPGYDPRWADRSPGHVLLWTLIERAFAEGLAGIDLLRGAEPYKAMWATQAAPLGRVVGATSLLGRLALPWLVRRAVTAPDGGHP
ncbi:MAG: GNAT family N-acetyltransferase [Alphaproteobacteria bacterium]|nr:GNAT family N-acetyltransferase [Alphaproteobacteria bacterium]